MTCIEQLPEPPVVATPRGKMMSTHLVDLHAMPEAVVAVASLDEQRTWHTAEHKHRVHARHEFLGHRHGEEAVDGKVEALMRRAARHVGKGSKA